MNRRRLVLIAFLLVFGAALTIALRPSSGPSQGQGEDLRSDAAEPGDRAVNPSLYVWGAGEQRVYSIDVTSTSTAERASETESAMEVSMTLFVEVIGEVEDEGSLVRYRFGESTGQLTGVEDGEPYETPMPSLDGEETHAVVTADGRVLEWWTGADTDLASQQFFEQLIAEMQPQLERSSAWSREEATSLGAAQTAYNVTRADAMSADIERRRVTYSTLHIADVSGIEPARSYALASIDAGVLRSMSAQESIHATIEGLGAVELAFTLDATLTGVGRMEQVETVEEIGSRVAQSSASVSLARRASLLARLRGMTAESMLEDLFVFGPTGDMPNVHEWLWSATALLELDPALAADIVNFAMDPAVEGQGHAFALQVLGSVGHAEAQAAMREVLSLPNVQSDGGYDQLVQRGVLVPELDGESVAFYEGLAAHDDASVSVSASNVMASAANQALERGDTERSAEIARRLSEDFDVAPTAAERRERLRIMGNLQDPAMAEPLLEASYDADANLRGAAARGLRHQSGSDVNDRLYELAVDDDPYVRRNALATMVEKGMSASQWESLAPSMASGVFGSRDETYLLRAVEATEAGSPARAAALASVNSVPGLSGRAVQELMQLQLLHELAQAN